MYIEYTFFLKCNNIYNDIKKGLAVKTRVLCQ